MPTERAALCGLISMDATMRSNLTVGPPVELYVLNTGNLQAGSYLSFAEDNAYIRSLRSEWNTLMEKAIDKLPPLKW